MSENIQFDTDQEGLPKGQTFASRTVFDQTQASGMAAWLIKKGIVKSRTQAEAVLFGIFFADIILTGLVIYFFIIK